MSSLPLRIAACLGHRFVAAAAPASTAMPPAEAGDRETPAIRQAAGTVGTPQGGPNTAPPRIVRPPNIILIIADDLGLGDLGCYGQRFIRTPNLDRLARMGARFTQHYAGASLGAAARCTLLTGRHTGHADIRGSGPIRLGDQTVTLAAVLQQAGYATALIGKWGLCDPPVPGDPLRFGFQTFYGYLDPIHAHNYYPDFLWKNDTKCPIKGNVVEVRGRGGVAIKKSQYSHHLFTREAMTFVTEQRDRPFFLVLAYTIPHANIEAGEDGLEVPDTSPYEATGWPEPQKRYAAMVSRLDASVGQLIEHLRLNGVLENTLVLFTSDNGPHADAGVKPAFFDSTAGLRGHKGQLYEGGIRVPLLAFWPGMIPAGRVVDTPVAHWDYLPTLAEIARAKVPADIDGVSFASILLSDDTPPKALHEYLYWEQHNGYSQQAIRLEQWKGIAVVGGPFELYDLSRDPRESRNVASEHPAILQRMLELMKTARSEHPAYPLKPAGPPANGTKGR